MSTALTTLTGTMAKRFDLGDDGGELLASLKQTAFKGQVSDAQMMALLVVANQFGLNPWTREIYAFPDRQNGIIPVVGVDGWSRIINNHAQFDGMEFEDAEDSCTCRIYRKDRQHATAITEYLKECKRDTAPWKSHPRRMMRHKAMIQCARVAFGFCGIFDQDEAERIVEKEINPITVRQTGRQAAESARQKAEESIDADQRAVLIAYLEQIAVTQGAIAYADEFANIGKEGRKTIGADEHTRLKQLAEQSDAAISAAESEAGSNDD